MKNGLIRVAVLFLSLLASTSLFSSPTEEELSTIRGALAIPEQSLIESLKSHIVVREDKNSVGHILIEEKTAGISQSTWLYVNSALKAFKAMEPKPIFVILELNTPGGEVFAAQQISDALKNLDINDKIPVVTFINNWAISAGAMLAYSSRYITVTKDGSMGAAEPVLAGEGGEMKSASEKVNSALRADMSNRARFFDRNGNIAEAMVDKDIILVFRDGKIVRVNKEGDVKESDILITKEGKLLTLNAEQLVSLGVADLMLSPEPLEAITEKEQNAGSWPLSKTLLGKAPFFREIPQAVVVSYRPDWRTRFFIFLATPVVSSLLMLGLLIGFYLEVNTPGFGLPGAVATTCLILIIISNLSLDIANWLEVIFFFVGIVLVVVDLFLLPTGGILLFMGGIIALGSLFAITLPAVSTIDFEFDTKTLSVGGELFFERLAWLAGTLLVAFVIMVIVGRFIRPSFIGINRLVLMGSEQEASQGYIAGENPETLPKKGAAGTVLATLRPSGKVMIDGVIYEAVTDGIFIEKGQEVVVTKLDGSVIVVGLKGEKKE